LHPNKAEVVENCRKFETLNWNFENLRVHTHHLRSISRMLFLVAFFLGLPLLLNAEQNRYIVVHFESLGLGNRLRSLSDWYNIGKMSNREILLSWVPSADCNASFLDLFQSGPNGMKLLEEPLPLAPLSLISAQSMAAESNLSFAKYEGDEMFFEEPAIFLSDVNVIYTDYCGAIILTGTSCQKFMSTRSSFYRALKPTTAIQEDVDQVMGHFEDRQ
jgi:hypothetical protein